MSSKKSAGLNGAQGSMPWNVIEVIEELADETGPAQVVRIETVIGDVCCQYEGKSYEKPYRDDISQE